MMLTMLYGSFSLTGTWTKFAMPTSCQISSSQGLIIRNRLNVVNVLWLNHRDIKHPRAGGAERTIMELSKRLYPKNIHLTLVTGGYIGNNANENDQKYELYRFRGNIGPHIASPHFLKQNYDVVVDDLAHVVPWFSESLTNIPGTVFFRHLHARSLKGQVSRPLEFALSFIERNYGVIYRRWPFVTESNTGVSDLIDLGIDRPRIIRILPGVDTDKFNVGRKTPFPSLVYVGRMMEYKRPDHAVRAMKEVIKNVGEAKLFMIGDGPFIHRLRDLVSKLNLEKNVKILGKVSDAELVNILSSSWVNVHTSITEGWGYSIMEASASGVPTVAYQVPGVVDAISPGVNGELVESGNVKALANAILANLDSPLSMVESSRKYAELFSWDRAAENWAKHLKNTAEGMYIH